jgi:hypothetical protein
MEECRLPAEIYFALTGNPVQVTLQAGKAIRCGGFVFPAEKMKGRGTGLRPTHPRLFVATHPRLFVGGLASFAFAGCPPDVACHVPATPV